MTIEDQIRSALRDDAGAATALSDGWDDVRARADAHTRRRRAIRYPVAGLVAAAAIAAIVVGVAALRSTSESEPPRIATPSGARMPEEIVSVIDGNLVALDSRSASIVRTLASTTEAGAPSKPTVSAGGEAVYFSRTGIECEVARVPLDGGAVATFGPGVGPTISPDGRWLATTLGESSTCGSKRLIFSDVRSGAAQPGLSFPAGVELIGWSADSRRVLIRTFPGAESAPPLVLELDVVAGFSRREVDAGSGYPLTYLGDTGFLATALLDSDRDGFTIVSVDPENGNVRDRLAHGATGEVVTLTADASGRHLLYWVATDKGRTQTLWRKTEGNEPVRLRSEVARSSGGLPAAWVPGQQSSPPVATTPATTPETTPTTGPASPGAGPETLVAVDADGRLIVMASDDSSRRSELLAPPTDGSQYETVSVGPGNAIAVSRITPSDSYCATFESGQIQLVDRESSGVETVGQGRFPALSPDGKRLAWVGVADCVTVLRIRDLATGAESVLTSALSTGGGPDPQLSGPITWAPDSQHLMVPMNVEPLRDWWYVDADSPDGTLSGPQIKQRGEQGGPFAVAFEANMRLAAVVADPDGSNLRVGFLDEETGEERGSAEIFGDLPQDIAVLEFQSNPKGEHFLAIAGSAGERTLYRLDPSRGLVAVATGIASADW